MFEITNVLYPAFSFRRQSFFAVRNSRFILLKNLCGTLRQKSNFTWKAESLLDALYYAINMKVKEITIE